MYWMGFILQYILSKIVLYGLDPASYVWRMSVG
jgi:hypothetical protein